MEQIIIETQDNDDFASFLGSKYKYSLETFMKFNAVQKGNIFQFFVYDLLINNGILCWIHSTSISCGNKNWEEVSDGNIDLMVCHAVESDPVLVHGRYLTLHYMAQLKWKKDGSYLDVKEIREFISTVRSRPKHELCLLITTATLSKHAENEIVNFDEKDRVIICEEKKKRRG
ncbi:9383_t:CDS:2 [Cetraspora pellucida]|uniref:9383_t:CDS:1 n=1 Tax=Cetraspora pellucida TaxID=1433469 RepID=A0A9N9BPR2_9GLOM|nr:9383_t:CDS:2 [Cetraspora pellucida]